MTRYFMASYDHLEKILGYLPLLKNILIISLPLFFYFTLDLMPPALTGILVITGNFEASVLEEPTRTAVENYYLVLLQIQPPWMVFEVSLTMLIILLMSIKFASSGKGRGKKLPTTIK